MCVGEQPAGEDRTGPHEKRQRRQATAVQLTARPTAPSVTVSSPFNRSSTKTPTTTSASFTKNTQLVRAFAGYAASKASPESRLTANPGHMMRYTPFRSNDGTVLLASSQKSSPTFKPASIARPSVCR